MDKHQNRQRSATARLIAGVIVAIVAVACTGGPRGAGGEAADRATGGVATEDLVPVPPVVLITKTAANDPDRFEASRLIVESWNAAGIPAELLPVEDALLNQRTFEGKDFDTYFISYGPTSDRLDPDNLLGRLVTANAGDAGNNVSGYMNADYDELYVAQATAPDSQSRFEAVAAMQRLVYEHLPVRPIFHPVVGAAYRADAWDGISAAVGNPLFNVWNAIEAVPLTDRNTLLVGTTFEPPTLNPTIIDTLEAQLPLSLTYDFLFRIGRSGELVNWAAQDLEVDGTELTVTLRPGMTFHDGQPVTADDVVFTLEFLSSIGSPAFASRLTGVEDVEAVDDLTVAIRLGDPSAAFPTVALAAVPILPRHVWEGIDEPLSYETETPVGSGPFIITGRALGQSVTFEANADHFAAPNISRLELVIVGSFDAGIGALRTGEIDLLDDVQNAVNFAPLEGRSDIEVVKTESHGWRGLHFNMRRAPFDDRHFRQALSYLIPTDDIIDVIVDGNGAPAGSLIAPSLREWHAPDLAPYEYSVDKAFEALEAGGYVIGDDETIYYPPSERDSRIFDNDVSN